MLLAFRFQTRRFSKFLTGEDHDGPKSLAWFNWNRISMFLLYAYRKTSNTLRWSCSSTDQLIISTILGHPRKLWTISFSYMDSFCVRTRTVFKVSLYTHITKTSLALLASMFFQPIWIIWTKLEEGHQRNMWASILDKKTFKCSLFIDIYKETRPCFSTDQNNWNNLGRWSLKEHLCQISFKSGQHFWTRRYTHISKTSSALLRPCFSTDLNNLNNLGRGSPICAISHAAATKVLHGNELFEQLWKRTT